MSWLGRSSGGWIQGHESSALAGASPPGESIAALLRVIDALLDQDHARAEDALCDHAQRANRPPAADILLAKLYLRRGEHARAVRSARAILIRPDLSRLEAVEALATLGEALSAAGQPAQAMAAYEEALHGEPRHRAALAGRVRLLSEAGRPGDALSLLTRLERVEGQPLTERRAGLLRDQALSERAAGHEGRARRLEQKAERLVARERPDREETQEQQS